MPAILMGVGVPGQLELDLGPRSPVDAWTCRALAGGLLLERRDGEGGRGARWYAVCVQPTLWGDVDLIRRWGALGVREGHPHQLIYSHPDDHAVLGTLRRVLGVRHRHGYRAAS